jgi:hypothetical protein
MPKIFLKDYFMKLSSFYVVPAYTFFYWGFTLKKDVFPEFKKFFGLKEGSLTKQITLTINRKKYDAQIRIARINNKGKIKNRSDTLYPEREMVQIFYNNELATLKALRKLVIYSYASTIDKSKPKLKELLEFVHTGDDNFNIKVVSKQETDFDNMFQFLEDKNLFAFWIDENQKKKRKDKLFVSYSPKWIPKKDLKKYSTRTNVIYLLNNSKEKQLYVGKANVFGDRVKESSSRIAMDSFDRFMFFELHPEYSFMLENLENYSIRLFAGLFKNLVKVQGLDIDSMKLVNKQIKK